MIVRIVAIDPAPPDPSNDVIVYQVPEHSRAYALLIELLDNAGIEFVKIEPPTRHKRKQEGKVQSVRAV